MMASNIANMGSASLIPSLMASEVPDLVSQSETLPGGADKKIKIQKGMTAEEYVKNYFSDIPIMVEIAKCESRFRQYDGENGEVLRGEKNNLDRGVMQINEFYHNEDSERLGYDILTIEGNTAYARYLFEKYGVKPWKSSSGCWSKSIAYSEYKDLAINK